MITVADVMTREVLVLHAETSLRDAVVYLANQHVSGAPVVDTRGHLTGAISSSDLLQAESEGMDLDTTTIEEVMTRRTLTVRPETELREAALAIEPPRRRANARRPIRRASTKWPKCCARASPRC